MWSVWSDSAEIYLGQSMSLLKPRGRQAVAVDHSVTLPVDRVLSKLADIGSRKLTAGTRLRISLGGALCPALSFAVPQGLRAWNELFDVARASAAATLGGDAGDWWCEMDIARAGIAAVMPVALKSELAAWAKQHGWQIASLQPLWAQATHAAGARAAGVQGVVVQEPGIVTILLASGTGAVHATSLGSMPSLPHLPPEMRRWLASHDATSSRLFSLGFASHTEAPPMSGAPQAWAPHWYAL